MWVVLCLVAGVSKSRAQTASDASSLVASEFSDRCPCIELSAAEVHDHPHLAQDYGILCERHDQYSLHEDCAGDDETDRTSWCYDAWCYVDPIDCSLPFEWSLDILGRAFSYTTCGHIDAFTSHRLELALQNISMNVVYLTNSGGWKGSFCEFQNSVSCTGPMAHLWNVILERGASTMDTRTFTSKYLGTMDDGRSPFSPQVLRETFEEDPDQDSAFAACVFATGMGFVDICVGAFTMKPSRLLLSDMIEVGIEPVVLVVKMTQSDRNLLQYLAACARPFAPTLWASFLGAFIFIAIATAVQERESGGKFEGKPFYRAVAHSTYQAVGASFGVVAYEPTTSGSNLTALALGVLVFFVVATYTAELATMLVLGSVMRPDFRSIDEAVSAGKLCLGDGLEAGLRAAHPEYSDNVLLVMASRSDVLPGLDAGECVASVMKREDLDIIHSAGDFCHMMSVGEVLFTVGFGVPVSSRVQRSLSLMHAQSETIGEWVNAKRMFEPESMCVPQQLEGAAMDVASMSGPFVVSAVFLVMGLSVTFVTHWFREEVAEETQPCAVESLRGEMGHMREELAAVFAEVRAARARTLRSEDTSISALTQRSGESI